MFVGSKEVNTQSLKKAYVTECEKRLKQLVERGNENGQKQI